MPPPVQISLIICCRVHGQKLEGLSSKVVEYTMSSMMKRIRLLSKQSNLPGWSKKQLKQQGRPKHGSLAVIEWSRQGSSAFCLCITVATVKIDRCRQRPTFLNSSCKAGKWAYLTPLSFIHSINIYWREIKRTCGRWPIMSTLARFAVIVDKHKVSQLAAVRQLTLFSLSWYN
jgi:hypothetical protein